jgi:UDP-2,3-diacylglucosamine pyrophosphatase LpxH
MSARGYVAGDFHLGAGPGDPLEDFRDDDLFAKCCGRIAGPETTLILNGDIIDFAQIPPFDVPKAANLLWTEQASLTKLRVALTEHGEFFAALAAFLKKGSRVEFLIGNHDLDMVWPAVQAELATELGSPPRDCLRFTIGATVFHGVHVEHGHHFTPENCPRVTDQFLSAGPGGVPYLERVWGTDFMLRFYNQLERDYPFADKVKPMLTVVWHGLRQGWIGGGEIARFFLFLKRRGIPWSGIASAVLSPPTQLTPASAAATFDAPAWKQAILERGRRDPEFVIALNEAVAELDPAEQRLATTSEKIETLDPSLGNDGSSATLGVIRDDRELRAGRDRLGGAGITHVVFGHTHAVVDGELGGRLFNHGTWLKHLDLKAEHVKAKIKQDGITLEVLKDDRLYAADRRLVRIDADPHYQAQVRLVTDNEP